MLQEEIIVAPLFEARIVGDVLVASTGTFEAGMKRNRIRIVLPAPKVEHGRQIGAAAEPGFLRDDEARVHMHRRHVRVPRMGDQRNAGGPEMRIGLGAGNLLSKFRRERAVDGGGMNAGLFEDAAMQQGHFAAAAIGAQCILALPGRDDERARRAIRRRERAGTIALQSFEGRANLRLQRLEPRLRLSLMRRGLAVRRVHVSHPSSTLICRIASPRTMAAATATFKERSGARIGMRTLTSAASRTSSGTPIDSRPTRRISPGA